ncbi:MAG: RNA-binding protein [Candidatus Marsarchaeota archaeon]|jgi:exosome complex component RRP42|nr:RNA-binding protein [Candidatus Marsarchaeota archaeon]
MGVLETLRGNYAKELLDKGIREDMRGMHDFRKISVKRGVIEHAEGSAQVDIGNTRVLAGIKLMVDEPMPDTPDQGNLVMNAELLPMASADYETGPPSPESIELARVVDRGIRAGPSIDLPSLIIEEGKCWTVFADVYVLNYAGNLFDASQMAAMAALLDTRIPKYEDGNVIREESSGKLKVDKIVASTTFGKIGSALLLDMNKYEESVAECRLTIATDGSSVRAMQKGLSGSFSVREIDEMAGVSLEKYKELKDIIESTGE